MVSFETVHRRAESSPKEKTHSTTPIMAFLLEGDGDQAFEAALSFVDEFKLGESGAGEPSAARQEVTLTTPNICDGHSPRQVPASNKPEHEVARVRPKPRRRAPMRGRSCCVKLASTVTRIVLATNEHERSHSCVSRLRSFRLICRFSRADKLRKGPK